MTRKEDIVREIDSLKDKLQHVEGKKTEVYSRIVGYYRSVNNWNKGKKEEYKHRQTFTIDNPAVEKLDEKMNVQTKEVPVSDAVVQTSTPFNITINDRGEAKTYKLFYSENCPGCPPVKNYLRQLNMDGEEIDASTDEGFAQAIKHQITGTPTVLFLDGRGEIVNKAFNTTQIETAIA